jgi:hypothetical protein
VGRARLSIEDFGGQDNFYILFVGPRSIQPALQFLVAGDKLRGGLGTGHTDPGHDQNMLRFAVVYRLSTARHLHCKHRGWNQSRRCARG